MSTSILEQAHHFTVGKIEVAGQRADTLRELYHNIAAGALLNSDERSDAPKCHPETRIAVQQELFSFVTDQAESTLPKRILWLTGPAGSGKTTIMNTIGEHFKRGGNLAAAFFFSSFSGSRERRTKTRFVTTLAYQLIQHDILQGVREEVLTSISRNPAIFKMSLKEQLEVLILQPLRLCQTRGNIPSHPPQVILVDGLDECEQTLSSNLPQHVHDMAEVFRDLDQKEVLDVLLRASNDPAFPFRVIVASRPEPTISEFFSTTAEKQSNIMFLDNKYNPSTDIALFLRSHFARIRRKCRLPLSWPGEDVIFQLVGNASEQIIYAATVIRFIEAPSKSPRIQLDIVLENQPTDLFCSPNPFTPLDTLYARILHSSSDPHLAFMWLKAYHLLNIEEGLTTWTFNRLCESSEGEADRLFANMSALVFISHQEDVNLAQYTFYHKSFQDFLCQPSRYGKYLTISEEESHEWLVELFLQIFEGRRPVGPLTALLSDRFTDEIFKLWYLLVSDRDSSTQPYDKRLANCDAALWIPRANLRDQGGRAFTMLMFVVSHSQCRPFKPCRRVCKRWRKLILEAWKYTYRDSVYISLPGNMASLLDRFGLKRIPLRSSGFGVTLFHQAPGRGSVIDPEHRAEGSSRPWGPIESRSIAVEPPVVAAEKPAVAYTAPPMDEVDGSRSWVSFEAWSSRWERHSGSAEGLKRDGAEPPNSIRTFSEGSKPPSPDLGLLTESRDIFTNERDTDWNSRKLGRYHAELYRQRSRASSVDTGGVSVATGDSAMF